MSDAPTAADRSTTHRATYGRFLRVSLRVMTDGGPAFYAWMTFLTAVALVGASAWAHQVSQGMALTAMTDHVSWGLYIANFTFIVGLAAGAVMMVIPAYLYHDREMHDVVIIGELLAVAAIVMCLMFVTVDLGRPDRVLHLLPIIGRFNWPISMLTWDVIVLNGYLVLNLHVASYLVYTRFRGRTPNPKWYVPFVFFSIFWAISIHTVTAFLYSGLGGRTFWNTAILAPRFIASAFVTGPAFIILTLQILRRVAGLQVGHGPIRTLTGILRVTILLNLFMVASEVFTQFYTGGHHAASAQYLYFGLHGHNGLVPWIWTAIALNVGAAGILMLPGIDRRMALLDAACVMAFVGLWIEKGMGLIIPAFIPSTLHEIVE
ncbi:MAG: polysulfide reductase NrfD, partial [Phycisphaerales bacterium]|nr:polysulfide reductase NrfD [Phycisphaerales bacterium]